MGASILVHWPDATEEDEGDHPGFSNDDHAWASWLVAALQSASAMQLLQQLGVAALLSHTTEGADADEIEFTSSTIFLIALPKPKSCVPCSTYGRPVLSAVISRFWYGST